MESEKLGFVERARRLLERVEYRRADTDADKHAIYRLRHDAYMRAGTVEPRPSKMFHDSLDEADNVWLIGILIDGELASSLRLHISATSEAPLPVSAAFPDVVVPHLDAHRIVIDPTRFVSKLEFSRNFPELPYITIRPTFLAAEFFAAHYITVACLTEHRAFYRRMFGGELWQEPRPYPNFNRPMALIGHACHTLRERSYKRYPFYESSAVERKRLFSRSSNVEEAEVLRAIGVEAEVGVA